MAQPGRMISIGILLVLLGPCLPFFIRLLRELGFFGGPWGGFGLFVIAIKLWPWIAGCGALAILVGVLKLRKGISN
jgi:hypothetical protein